MIIVAETIHDNAIIVMSNKFNLSKLCPFYVFFSSLANESHLKYKLKRICNQWGALELKL